MATSTRRAHVVLPKDLVRQIDKIVGARGRSAFLAELARPVLMTDNRKDFPMDKVALYPLP